MFLQWYPDKCSFNDILKNFPSKRETNWNGSLLNPGSLRDNPNDPEPKNFAASLRACSAVCGRTASWRRIAPRRHFPWPLNAWAIIRTAQRDQFSQAGHRVVLSYVLTRKHVLWITRARIIQSPLSYVPTWFEISTNSAFRTIELVIFLSTLVHFIGVSLKVI